MKIQFGNKSILFGSLFIGFIIMLWSALIILRIAHTKSALGLMVIGLVLSIAGYYLSRRVKELES